MFIFVLLIILSNYLHLVKSCNEDFSKRCKHAVVGGNLSSFSWSGKCSTNNFMEYTHACQSNYPQHYIDHCCCKFEYKIFCCKYKLSPGYYRCIEWEDLVGNTNTVRAFFSQTYNTIIIIGVTILFLIIIIFFCRYRKSIFGKKIQEPVEIDVNQFFQPSAPAYELGHYDFNPGVMNTQHGISQLITNPASTCECTPCLSSQECPLHHLPSYEESQSAYNRPENTWLGMNKITN